MVRRVNDVYMPTMSKGMKSLHVRGKRGMGFGAVLLNGGIGGAGSASSYPSLDEYASTTHRNPYNLDRIGGKGLEGVSKKLEGLNVKHSKKQKNIQFTL
ncbi:MAG: hypothetical protein EB127_02275 [Alphaproteobacteria bacterium]|nr:hypothetical protein [Alphaproteobacteria bacterium]